MPRPRWPIWLRLDPAVGLITVAAVLLMLQLPRVPGLTVVLGLLAITLTMAASLQFARLGGVATGAFRILFWFCLAALSAAVQMRSALLASPWQAQHGGACAAEAHCDIDADIEVIGLPQADEERLRFDARILRSDADPERRGPWAMRTVRLAWYAKSSPRLAPGDRLRVTLRLRRPHAQVNPGSFDFERYAVQTDLAAVGYLRQRHQMLDAAPFSLDRFRWQLAERVDQSAGPASARFIRALSLGDTRGLSDADWQLLRKTGLSHLLAISGLHIGLIAGLGALMMRATSRWAPAHLPRPIWCAIGAVAFALPYAGLAGFGLPVRRALLMLLVFLLAVLLRRRVHPWQGLGLAALAVALFDPLALLGAGFWLSFAGVFWLMLCLPQVDDGRWRWLGSLVRAQWVLALGLLPLSVVFFAQTSWIAAPLNLLAVPLVGFVLVPLVLLAIATLSVAALSTPLFAALERLMALGWRGLEWVADLPGAASSWPEPSSAAVLMAVLGITLLLLPRGFPWRGFGLLLLLPLAWPVAEGPQPGALRIQVLDVGQGLAVWVETRHHSLLYDTGPGFRSGSDASERTVIPALLAQQGGAPSLLVLSHGDQDHAGGRASLNAYFGSLPTLAGEPIRNAPATPCQSGLRWRWDGVEFEFLHPPTDFPELGNDSSCVLKVSADSRSILIPGDIGAVIEQRLLNRQPDKLASDVLLLPHHGSKHSSTPAFLDAVAARAAIVATGYDNAFGHPAPELAAELGRRGTALFNTASSGAIDIRWGPGEAIQIEQARRLRPRFWRSAAAAAEP